MTNNYNISTDSEWDSGGSFIKYPMKTISIITALFIMTDQIDADTRPKQNNIAL